MKPIEYTVCEKGVTRKGHLTRHLRVDNVEKQRNLLNVQYGVRGLTESNILLDTSEFISEKLFECMR